MTHDHVAGFASELVKMAQAVERVPELEATIHRQEAELRNLADSKADLYDQLQQSRKWAATLEQRLFDMGVARDDAELRFLEADDAKETLARVLDSLGKDILGALQAVAPMPQAEPARAAQEPVSVPVSPAVMEAVTVDAPIAEPVHIWAMDHTQGQSVVDPTSAPVPVTGPGPEPITPSSEGVSVPVDPIDVTTFVDVTPPGSATSTEVASTQSDYSRPFALTVPITAGSPPAASSAADITDDERIDHYYGWHPNDKMSIF